VIDEQPDDVEPMMIFTLDGKKFLPVIDMEFPPRVLLAL
jgi:hypothetical protein